MGLPNKIIIFLLFHLNFYKRKFISVQAFREESLKVIDAELKFITWLNSILHIKTYNYTLIRVSTLNRSYKNTIWISYQLVISGISDKL